MIREAAAIGLMAGGVAFLAIAALGVMRLPDAVADGAVAQRAAVLGLGVRALSAYARPPVRCNGLVRGYGNLDEDNVAEAVRRLALAVGG